MSRSFEPDSSISGRRSGANPDWLDLDELPLATGAAAEAMERNSPGPVTLDDYARFVKSFSFTSEQLRAIPTSEGQPRFTLDD